MSGQPVARFSHDAIRKADALAGDSILTLAGLPAMKRGQVVELACDLLVLVTSALAKGDADGDPRMVTEVVSHAAFVLLDRYVANREDDPLSEATQLDRIEAAVQRISDSFQHQQIED